MKQRQNIRSLNYAMGRKNVILAVLLAACLFSGMALNANGNIRHVKKVHTVKKRTEKPAKVTQEPYEIKPTILFFS
jgi:hypothetical protein